LATDFFIKRFHDFSILLIFTTDKINPLTILNELDTNTVLMIVDYKIDTQFYNMQNTKSCILLRNLSNLYNRKYFHMGNPSRTWRSNNFSCYNNNNYNPINETIFNQKTFTKFLSYTQASIYAIQELSYDSFSCKQGGEILNRLLEKYIGDNVIPYDIEARKKLYPLSLAFEELKDYMKDNENK